MRDCAKAHLNAIKVEEAKNSRFILNGQSLWFREIAEFLKAEYGQWYNIKSGELKYCTLKIAAIFDKQARLIVPMWGKSLVLENKKSKEILGIEYEQPKFTVCGMAESMIQSGLIKDKRK